MYNIFKGMTLPCKSQMHDRCFSHGAGRLGQSICLKEGKGLWNPFNRWKWQGSRESIRILGKSCLSHLNNGTPWFQSRGGCQQNKELKGTGELKRKVLKFNFDDPSILNCKEEYSNEIYLLNGEEVFSLTEREFQNP